MKSSRTLGVLARDFANVLSGGMASLMSDVRSMKAGQYSSQLQSRGAPGLSHYCWTKRAKTGATGSQSASSQPPLVLVARKFISSRAIMCLWPSIGNRVVFASQDLYDQHSPLRRGSGTVYCRDSMSFTAHRFFGRLSSCSVTSIPSPPWRWPSSRYHTSPSGSNYLHSVRSLTPKPCSPIKLSSVIPKWCGARTSSHYHRVRHHDYGTPLGGVFTRFTFHTLRKTPGSRHREI
jgi:hypothetical protein